MDKSRAEVVNSSMDAGTKLFNEVFEKINSHLSGWGDDIDHYIALDYALSLWGMHHYSCLSSIATKEAVEKLIQDNANCLKDSLLIEGKNEQTIN